MTDRARTRYRIWAVLAIISAVLAVVTLVWKDWIEIVFRVDPDGGSGWLEWAIAAAALVATLTFGALARRDRPRARTPVEQT